MANGIATALTYSGAPSVPQNLTICLNGTQPMVTIRPNGTIEYGANYTPDAAAKILWEAVGFRRALYEAAPELLAALLPFEELADEGNHDQPDDTKVVVHAGRSFCYGLTLADLRRVRAVIAKATGAA